MYERDDQRCEADRVYEITEHILLTTNRARHTADTIISWPNLKQWLIINITNLIMTIRYDQKRDGYALKHTAPYGVVMYVI